MSNYEKALRETGRVEINQGDRVDLVDTLSDSVIYYFDEIDIALMRVDKSVQGQIDKKRLKKIIEHFTPNEIGVLTVCKREDGYYYVADGQHRYLAMAELGIKKAPCQIFEGLTVEQEAQKYLYLNTERKTTKSIDSFLVSTISGDSTAIAIQAIIEKNGLEITTKTTNIRLLVKLYETLGGALCDRTLAIYAKSFDTNKLHTPVLLELAKVIGYNRHLDEALLVERLQEKGVDALLEQGRQMAQSKTARTKADAYNQIICLWYNHGLSYEQGVRLSPQTNITYVAEVLNEPLHTDALEG